MFNVVEYRAFAQIALSFFAIEVLEHYVIDGRFMFDPLWASFAVIGGALPHVRYSTLTQGNEAGVLYPIHH